VRRRAPRPVATALETFTARLAPVTVLAQVQGVWTSVVGEAIAAHARAVAEHGGVLEVVCDESVWAAELEMMGPELVDRLSASLGQPAIVSMRCRTEAPEGPNFP
jgi:predicted nucleic acid-binding Zn ribbon protein